MLYHYTSIEGFLGIISSKSLWASHCQYLNDASEYEHALNYAKNISSDIFMNDDYNAGFGFILRKNISLIPDNSNVFITSFSEKFDLLSQWRGYCPPNEGICIGFDKNIIKEFCNQNKFKFEKCIYEEEIQLRKIHEIVEKCYKSCPQHTISKGEYNLLNSKDCVDFEMDYHEEIKKFSNITDVFTKFSNSLIEYAPLIKNNGFYEEKEWRIICKSPNTTINFRKGKGYLIPFINLDLLNFSKEIIKEIIIGPNVNARRCEKSIKMVLERKGFVNVKIKHSTIPYI